MLERTWRWFGPNDPIALADIKQAGATGIVTALHDIANGQVWPIDAIQARKAIIEDAGLSWSVVESLPIHEAIKTAAPGAEEYIENYQQSLRNLAHCGLDTLCYNLMPAVDWTRTNLSVKAEDGAEYLRFDHAELAAFDIFILKRPGAEDSYPAELVERARALAEELGSEGQKRLEQSILAGLPGSEESWTARQFQDVLDTYKEIDDQQYRDNVYGFLKRILPVAEECGLRLAVHPDDPPFSLFGLPRVVSTPADLERLFTTLPSVANGVTLCVGSFGSRCDNNVPEIIERFGPRIQFIHLRNIRREQDGSFDEQHHLDGDLDMARIVTALVKEQERRRQSQSPDARLPWRPDHGLRMFDDNALNPGYSALGRMKGLAEIRGLELGIRYSLGLSS